MRSYIQSYLFFIKTGFIALACASVIFSLAAASRLLILDVGLTIKALSIVIGVLVAIIVATNFRHLMRLIGWQGTDGAEGAAPRERGYGMIMESKEFRSIDPRTEKMETVSKIEGLHRGRFASRVMWASLAAIGIAFVTDYFVQINPKWWKFFLIQMLVSGGTSIAASVIFYLLYARLMEQAVLEQVMQSAVNYADDLYQKELSRMMKRFDRMLPSKTYDESSTPSPAFEKDFEEVLKSSSKYLFKGDDGGFTAFRLAQLCQNSHLMDKDIKLLLLDPREGRLLRERVQVELKSQQNVPRVALDDGVKEMRKSIYVTLVAIFDIAHRARGLWVGFHKEHLFFRSEIFDSGIFLTYYLGGEFPSTSFYERGTFTYSAFEGNFIQNESDADPKIYFSSDTSEEELKKILSLLGCEIDLAELRKLKDDLFNRYSATMQYKPNIDSFKNRSENGPSQETNGENS